MPIPNFHLLLLMLLPWRSLNLSPFLVHSEFSTRHLGFTKPLDALNPRAPGEVSQAGDSPQRAHQDSHRRR